MISKELLSEVLNCEVLDIDNEIPDFIPLVSYMAKHRIPTMEKTFDADINIYELAHKCKEWAFQRWYDIYSCVDSDEAYAFLHNFKTSDVLQDRPNIMPFDQEIVADTEPEAIFKACEWIMEQGKQDGKM